MFGFEWDFNKEVKLVRSNKSRSQKKREANSGPHVIVNRQVCHNIKRFVWVFRAATQESFTLPQINCEFLDLILLREHSSLPTETS